MSRGERVRAVGRRQGFHFERQEAWGVGSKMSVTREIGLRTSFLILALAGTFVKNLLRYHRRAPVFHLELGQFWPNNVSSFLFSFSEKL